MIISTIQVIDQSIALEFSLLPLSCGKIQLSQQGAASTLVHLTDIGQILLVRHPLYRLLHIRNQHIEYGSHLG